MAWSSAFKKCIFFHFLETLFAKLYITGFCKKKLKFWKLQFFADSKSRE